MNYEELFWQIITKVLVDREREHPSESDTENLEILLGEFNSQTLEKF